MNDNMILKGVRRVVAILVWGMGLVFFLALPYPGQAAVEGITCLSEPTDMVITYGDLINCSININSDTDLFRFAGNAGEKVVVQITYQSGTMRPCIELIAPDNSRIEACQNAFTNRIDTTLTQTGIYTILADAFFTGTGDYTLALERLIWPSPNAHSIQYGEIVTDEINPQGDLDLFSFAGTAGTTIVIQATWQSGTMRPCIELIAPDNSRLKACQNAFSNRIDTILNQTGTYVVLVDVFYLGTGDYTLALERLISPSSNARSIQCNETLADEIDPQGDLDLFFFEGTGDTTIATQVTWQSGTMRPCIELIAPDNSRIKACQNAFSNPINTTLTQTGTYAVLVDVFFLGTGEYDLSLQYLSGTCGQAVYLPIIFK
jgi:hypothetical protein